MSASGQCTELVSCSLFQFWAEANKGIYSLEAIQDWRICWTWVQEGKTTLQCRKKRNLHTYKFVYSVYEKREKGLLHLTADPQPWFFSLFLLADVRNWRSTDAEISTVLTLLQQCLCTITEFESRCRIRKWPLSNFVFLYVSFPINYRTYKAFKSSMVPQTVEETLTRRIKLTTMTYREWQMSTSFGQPAIDCFISCRETNMRLAVVFHGCA